ncbi:MAG: 1-deoxy-D-xylulose-5-phosphate reductoisomerase [Candidatus Hydrogenedentes bacterium]|nr:1-deoxy-D-xylulose-5-phosphate reductoisomerase [Candidatus Hydrogenedentota bacterium]
MTGSPPRHITVLGSTGSIGRNALDVVRNSPGAYVVDALAANANVDLLAAQIREFAPRAVAVHDRGAAAKLREMMPGLDVLEGQRGLAEAAARPVDTVLCAVVGAAGLPPLLAAIDAGNRIALANKEPLVMAGELVMARAARRGVDILPVDSEHSAIFQCLGGRRDASGVRCILLTASGGPFYGRTREELGGITPEQAARHPRWRMGAKISVDSATLMNKGLEIIEAMHLFGVPHDRIGVVIHPESVVHGLVEFSDGNILAQMGVTDMRAPIAYALAYPERAAAPVERLDLAKLGSLTFAAPDTAAFPCLDLARGAARQGGGAPAVLNGANEQAVAAFCAGRISFLAIGDVVACALDRESGCPGGALAEILDADRRARAAADEIITRLEN